jgi:hypothetical protein
MVDDKILIFSIGGKEAAIEREDMKRDIAESFLIDTLGVKMVTYIGNCRYLLDEGRPQVFLNTNRGQLTIEWASRDEAEHLLKNSLDSLL